MMIPHGRAKVNKKRGCPGTGEERSRTLFPSRRARDFLSRCPKMLLFSLDILHIISIMKLTRGRARPASGNWTAYYDPETDRYFAEIMYSSREGREQYDYEITKEIYSRLGASGSDEYDEDPIRTGRIAYSFQNTMYGTLGPERTVWDEEASEAMKEACRRQEKR